MPRVDEQTQADKRWRIDLLKNYIRKYKPTYRKLLAYAIVTGWSDRNIRITLRSMLEQEIIAVRRDAKGKPDPQGTVKVIDGKFVADLEKAIEQRAKKLEAMK